MSAPPLANVSSETVPARNRWVTRGVGLFSAVLYALANPAAWTGDVDDVLAGIQRPAWAFAFIALVPLQWAVRNMTVRQAYLYSTWVMVPGVFATLHWLTIAMNVFGGIPKLLTNALLLLLSFVGWNFMGTAVAVGRHLEIRFRWPAAVAVPVAWAGMEYARAHVYFGGFPWANLGTTQWNNLYMVQLGSLGGVYLIMVVLCLFNVAMFEVVRFLFKERAFPTMTVMAAVVSVALSCAYGAYRVSVLDAEAAAAPHVKVGLLQGNIEQGIINREAQHRDFIIAKYARLQHQAVAAGAEVVVWPEGALPTYISREETTMQGHELPPLEGAYGVVGIAVMWRAPPRLTGDACRQRLQPQDCRGDVNMHNSAVVVAPDQRIVGRFDKTHLVPFGEYVPWPLGGIAHRLVPGIGAYIPGESLKPVTLNLASGPHTIGGLICYEGIFPQYARQFSNDGVELLINITNDAWYGISSAATQHLAFYTMRAAENGRAVARAANTGISAAIDPAGRVVTPTRLFEDAALVVDLPLMTSRSVYTVTGDLVGALCALLYAAALGHALKGWYVARRLAKAADGGQPKKKHKK